jgi:hypothetical protein
MTRFALAGAAIAALTAASAFAAPPASTPAPAPAPQAQQGPRGMMGGDENRTRAQVQAETAAQFAAMDANKDGFVTAEELGDHGGPNMIERLDANHDGKLTLDEINARILQMFDMVDANHDGTVTPAERDAFREAMRARRGGGGMPGGAGGPGDQPPGQ